MNTTAAYNSEIENGIKSALFSLEGLMQDLHIVDPQLEMIREALQYKVVDAQEGKIEVAI